jgi:DNA-directed RNA polymerase subunit L
MGAVMELELVEKGKSSITVKVIGEDHTLCNALRKALYDDSRVVAASYMIEHPMLEHPKLYVKTKAKSPERALIDAAERLMGRCDEVHRKMLRALKK